MILETSCKFVILSERPAVGCESKDPYISPLFLLFVAAKWM